jgi:hypothetical protein
MSTDSSEPAPLEDKLSTLLKALAKNKTQGNGDSWNGKPQQEALPIRFVDLPSGSVEVDLDRAAAEQPEVEVVTKSAGPTDSRPPRRADQEESLDDLLQDYVRAVRNARAAGVSRTETNEPDQVHAGAQSTAGTTTDSSDGAKVLPPVRSAKDYENMSLGELVADLENLVL